MVRLSALSLSLILSLSTGCSYFNQSKPTNFTPTNDVWTEEIPAKHEPGILKSLLPEKPVDVSKCRLVTSWQKTVGYGNDPRSGVANPFLIGVVYISDEAGTLVTPKGNLQVELWDHTPKPNKTDPILLGTCLFRAEELGMFIRRDEMGLPNYKIAMPWATEYYSPAVKEVFVSVKFTSAENPAQTLMHNSGRMVLDHTQTLEMDRGGKPFVPAKPQPLPVDPIDPKSGPILPPITQPSTPATPGPLPNLPTPGSTLKSTDRLEVPIPKSAKPKGPSGLDVFNPHESPAPTLAPLREVSGP